MADTKNKVIIGMSGGVDSSVAALLLLQQGYDVEGLFMKNWEDDDEDDYCAAAEDLADAQSVCDKIGIKLHSVNFSDQYWDRVFQNFLDEYKAGRTPNPDILCNKEIKFKAFLDYAIDLGADYIATGHYVRRGDKDGKTQLLKGLDNNKDQSYFLYTLNQHQLSHALFPIGEMDKADVRKMAEEAELTTFNKKDSTGICFIGERKFKDFLERYLPAQPGEIQDPAGNVIGKHHGLMYYTLGQRKGLGIGGLKDQTEEPWFSVAKDLERNVLIAAQGQDNDLLFHDSLTASQLHWTSTAPPTDQKLMAKVRYRQADQECMIIQLDDQQCTVEFEQPQRAITPGQSIVFYHHDECLGGGIIDTMYNR